MNPPNGCLWLAKRCHGKNTWLEENGKQTSNFCKHQTNKCEMHFSTWFIDCHLSPKRLATLLRHGENAIGLIRLWPSHPGCFKGLQGPNLTGIFTARWGFLMGNTMGNTWSVVLKLQNAIVFFWKYLLWLSSLTYPRNSWLHFYWPYKKRYQRLSCWMFQFYTTYAFLEDRKSKYQRSHPPRLCKAVNSRNWKLPWNRKATWIVSDLLPSQKSHTINIDILKGVYIWQM